MSDVLVRMVDANSREVLPNQFLPAAERNGMMRKIDRWVLGSAVKACREQRGIQLFVRLSSDSIPDLPLVEWLRQQLHEGRHPAATARHSGDRGERGTAHVRDDGAGRCVAHARLRLRRRALRRRQGAARHDRAAADELSQDRRLAHAGTAHQPGLQQRVGSYIRAAKAKAITTIAERVEDANTMAVLWQLGVEFIQGYYVQGREQVVLETT